MPSSNADVDRDSASETILASLDSTPKSLTVSRCILSDLVQHTTPVHGQLRPLRFTTAAVPLLVNCCLGSFGTPSDGRAISQLSAACGACVTFASLARARMSSRGAFIDLSNLGTSICPHILSLTSISYHFCGTANLGRQHVGPAGLCCESVHRGHFETIIIIQVTGTRQVKRASRFK